MKCVLLDAGVPVSIGDKFSNAGWEVIHYNQVLAEKVTDDVVCRAAIANNAALVAIDKDMKQIARRYNKKKQKDQFAKLDLIMFGGSNVKAVKRSEQAISLIEHEWEYANAKPARRLWIEITEHYIRTER